MYVYNYKGYNMKYMYICMRIHIYIVSIGGAYRLSQCLSLNRLNFLRPQVPAMVYSVLAGPELSIGILPVVQYSGGYSSSTDRTSTVWTTRRGSCYG